VVVEATSSQAPADEAGAAGTRRRSGDPWGPTPRRGLRAWAADHYFVATDGLAHVSARLGTSLLVWVLIGIALALPGGLYVVQANLTAMLVGWDGRPGLSVYLRRDATLPQAENLRDVLAAEAGVGSVVLITPDEALQAFQAFAGLSDALAGLDGNPLPISLRVTVADGLAPVELDALAARVRQEGGVEEVSVERTWFERLQAMTEVVRRLGVTLTVLFGAGAVLVAATSVRLAIETRLDELRVMKLVGATDAYIRRPFLYFGLLYGLGGAVVSAMVISALLLVLEPPLARLFGTYGEMPALVGLTPLFFGQLLAVGAALGIGGALLAARQRLADLEIV
jgi:cell division transport system permease protein